MTMPSFRAQSLRASAFQLLIVGTTMAALPFAAMSAATAPGLVAFFAAGVIATEVATSYLLFMSFENERPWDQLILAAAYLYSGLMAIAHVLTFPGALIAQAPVIGAAPGGVAWIFVLWIVLFPGFCLAAVVTAVSRPALVPEGRTRALVCWTTGGIVGLVLLLSAVCVVFGGTLPALLSGGSWTGLNLFTSGLVVVSCAASIGVVHLRLQDSSLFRWLGMVLTAVACANLLAAAGGGRFTVGWTLGRLMWVVSGSILLVYFLGHHVRQRRELARANDRLSLRGRETEAQLAAIVSSTSEAILSKTPKGVVMSWNAAAEHLLGYKAADIVGRSIREIIPKDRQADEDRILGSIIKGVAIENYETERIHKSGEVVEVSVTVSPLHVGNRLIGASSIMHDIGARKRRERHAALLTGEVTHRSKNMLAVLQAVARQTTAENAEQFRSSFLDRIAAIAANHDLLVESEWKGVDLGDLVRAELASLQGLIGTRIHVGGPTLRLTGAAGQAIGMAIHELATNSAKYGALSVASGKVHVEWSLNGEQKGRKFRLGWTETGGPPVTQPSRHGFGSVLIVDMPRSVLNGDVDLEYPSEGVRWVVVAPLDEIVEKEA